MTTLPPGRPSASAAPPSGALSCPTCRGSARSRPEAGRAPPGAPALQGGRRFLAGRHAHRSRRGSSRAPRPLAAMRAGRRRRLPTVRPSTGARSRACCRARSRRDRPGRRRALPRSGARGRGGRRSAARGTPRAPGGAHRRRATTARGSRAPHRSLCRIDTRFDRVDDRGVSRAAAEMAGEHVHDLRAGRLSTREEVGGRDQDSRGAEAALERVVAPKGLLQRGQRTAGGERLDGVDAAPVGLHGEDAAATYRDAVQEDRACATDAVLAADVRPGQPQAVAEEVGQQEPRLDGLASPSGRSR